jgi:bifunctional non-homologous end joining protein LigD
VIKTKTKTSQSSADKLPVTISHPDKVFWPKEGYTKLDLAEYYAAIFDKLQPYVKDRILTLERCPDGMGGQCFYQKEKPQGMPAGTRTILIAHSEAKNRATNYVVGGTLETQLALVNLGCIAVHVMGTRAASPHKPDWVCFDLDPGSGKFADAARAALQVKQGLDILKLDSYAKTSGGRGAHVFVPIRPGPDTTRFCNLPGHSAPLWRNRTRRNLLLNIPSQRAAIECISTLSATASGKRLSRLIPCDGARGRPFLCPWPGLR